MDVRTAVERREKLLNEGWERRFTSEEPRLTEMKQFYESLGLEVIVEDLHRAVGECSACFESEGFENRYKTIYTREKSGTVSDPDDLF